MKLGLARTCTLVLTLLVLATASMNAQAGRKVPKQQPAACPDHRARTCKSVKTAA